MHHSFKRYMAALMCSIMCISSIPMPAFADTNDKVVVDMVDENAVVMTDDAADETESALNDTASNDVDITQQSTDESNIIQDETVQSIETTGDNVDITNDVQPNPTYEKQRSVSATANGITVYVEGILPYKTSLSVKTVSRTKQANYETIIDGMDETTPKEVMTVLDVSLIDAKGQEFEPDNTMLVTFVGGAVNAAVNDPTKTIEVYHVIDENINAIGSNATEDSFEDMNATNVEAQGVAFETDSFSEYVVVLSEEHKDIQKEIPLNNDIKLELNKYLSAPKSEKNGQSTYTVTLEQALYDETSTGGKIQPPDRREIIMVIDQSASMAGAKSVASNTATRSFFERLMEVNQDRIEKANNGAYYFEAGDNINNHLLQMKAIIGYNNYSFTKWSGSLNVVSADNVDTLSAASSFKGWYRSPISDGDIMDGTRTDLGIKRGMGYVVNPKDTDFVLITDGEPVFYGVESPDSLDYQSKYQTPGEEIPWNVDNVDDCLTRARSLKDNGVTFWSIFNFSSKSNYASEAYASGDIHDIDQHGVTAYGIAFVSLLSSDYPKNGKWDHTGSGYDSSGMALPTYTSGEGRFGDHVFFPETMDDMLNVFDNLAKTIKISPNRGQGYAGETSYIYDVISQPFNLDGADSIHVYQVPRIKQSDGSFTWQPKETKVDDYKTVINWEEITDQVSISIRDGRILTIKGYDYETNAITTHNKFKSAAEETYPTLPGEYGYKIVVEFDIYAKRTFGGNKIETNDSDTSGFYPGTPKDGKDEQGHVVPAPVPWKDNTTLNPDKKPYIDLYPIPYVDLRLNYEVLADDVTIYAPQTAKLKNLVTDEVNNIFFVTPSYDELRLAIEKQEAVFKKATSDLAKAQQEYDANNSATWQAIKDAQSAYDEAVSKLEELKKSFENEYSYIPDGENNAYVDIAYKLTSPSGQVVATMNIPHGKKVVIDENNEPNYNWTYTGDGMVKESGEYKVTATLKPVTTVKGTDNTTGSSKTGTYKDTDFTKKAVSKIFILQITGVDTALEQNQTIDFFEGDTNIQTLASTGTDKHLIGFKWVCTDGKTESIPEEEPGSAKTAGSAVMGNISVPALASSRVKDRAVNVGNGEYIPVAVALMRTSGDINKDAPIADQENMKPVVFSSTDKLYGEHSSVEWKHVCDIVDDCDHHDFANAQQFNGTKDLSGVTAEANVRFLIHVMANPFPNVVKSVDKSSVLRGEDWMYSISMKNNDDIELNPDKATANFTVYDFIPYNNDGRSNLADEEGTAFNGGIKMTEISIDFSKESAALQALRNGSSNLYITTKTELRTAYQNRKQSDLKNNSNWTKLTPSISGTTATFTDIPANAIAVRFDTSMKFSKTNEIVLKITTAPTNKASQKLGDVFWNDACVGNGTRMEVTVPVRTEVADAFLDGTVWIDANGNGLKEASESRLSNLTVVLLSSHVSRNKAAYTIGGTAYDYAYNADGDKVQDYKTESDGYFRFDNLSSGTYYILVLDVDSKYAITKKNVGSDKSIDSDAETTKPMNDGAWIKNVKVSGSTSARNFDVGLKEQTGSVVVNKKLDKIYFSPTMEEEDRQNYNVTFTYKLTNTSTKKVYTDSISLNIAKMTGQCSFKDLPLGTYTLEEMQVGQYVPQALTTTNTELKHVIINSPFKATIQITADEQDFTFLYENKLVESDVHGDQNAVVNHAPMHIPVSLEVQYTGPDPVSDSAKDSYNFKQADFADIIVTYDDGTTASLKKGTLKFNQITLSPATITNTMNTPSGTKTSVTAYYSEKGHTVMDKYKVAVQLKPVSKLQVTYNANGSTFGSAATNVIKYGYDSIQKTVFVTNNQTYKNPNARGSNYTFTGWNTASNASGVHYANEDAVAKVVNTSANSLYLYAEWKTNITFNANGGTLSSGGTSKTETAYVDQIPGTTLTAKKSGHGFIGWNTKANGTGTWLDKYGKLTGPVTFYAQFYQTDFPFNGVTSGPNTGTGGSVQTFTAPKTGNYKIQVWGAASGADNVESNMSWGGYSEGIIKLNAGQKLYVAVGGQGQGPVNSGYPKSNGSYHYDGGWNGGGYATRSSGGGGATSVTTKNRGVLANFNSDRGEVVIVAGGAGGEDWGESGRAGYGGGLQGGPNASRAGTQTSGYSFGKGEDRGVDDAGGGGGGWYGGRSAKQAGGGSGYIGYSGLTNASTKAGNQSFPAVNSGNETGHRTHGYARIVLVN